MFLKECVGVGVQIEMQSAEIQTVNFHITL